MTTGVTGRQQIPVGVLVFAFPPAFLGGGPIRSVGALVANSPERFVPLVLTSNRDHGGGKPLDVHHDLWVPYASGEVYYAKVPSLRTYIRGLLAMRARHPKLLYLNSFFSPLFSIIPMLLHTFGFWGRTPILLAPRGEFSKGALAKSSWKKAVYIHLFRHLYAGHRVIWHSTASHETSAIRELWGPSATIVERANDVDLPPTALNPDDSQQTLRLIFLGRVTHYKGVHVVLEALKRCCGPITFDIYGPFQDRQYEKVCRDLSTQLPPDINVTFYPPVPHENARALFRRHDTFVLPTAGENFGHAIVEAMSASCIVLTTPTTPWTKQLRHGGGIVIDDRTIPKWADAISKLAARSPAERTDLRERAGAEYSSWAARSAVPHVWDLAWHSLAQANALGAGDPGCRKTGTA